MSDSDRRFELTGTQVVASLLAAITGAIAASYLGVAGTIIGTAVMSVASTAGAAVYKSYLGRTARRLKERAPEIAQRAAERMTAASARTSIQQVRADVTRADATRADATRADAARAESPAGDGEDEPASAEADGDKPGPAEGERPARRGLAGWLRRQPMWVLAALATVGIFLGAVAGVSVVELAAGKPLQALVWHHKGTGTTVGGLVGGGSPKTEPAAPVTHSAKPTPSTTPSGSTSPSPSPSVTPTSASPTPTSTSPSSTSPTSTSSPTAGASPSPSP